MGAQPVLDGRRRQERARARDENQGNITQQDHKLVAP
jgi:hypothetical protein